MEKRTARNWYWWLWLSPLVTVPSYVFLWFCGYEYLYKLDETVTILIAVFGSALWHLILLFPALNQESEFVRWHGRQALLLAGVRTAVPLVFVLVLGLNYKALLFIPVLIAVWFFGTLWGQLQAARGDCSLMYWLGQVETPPSRMRAEEPAQVAGSDTEALVDIIRHNRDPQQRRQALLELEKLGMVEPL